MEIAHRIRLLGSRTERCQIGAGLGASRAILVIGGYGPRFMIENAVGFGPVVVTLAALVGAASCA